MVEVSESQFEELVAAALRSIPSELGKLISNVAIVIEPDSPGDGPYLLGLYQGVPVTERGPFSYAGMLPDKITIYRNPILHICRTESEVIAQTRITVMHEIGHYFGIDDARLHELGYG